MKKLHLYIIFMFVAVVGYGQNLVPNGDFEDTVSCPNSSGQITFASGWNPYSSSPDYFNSCAAPSTDVSVPSNIMGYRNPASGNAYSGIINYVKGETNYSLNREIIGRQLSSPLIIGQKYFASFKVSLAIAYGANMATDKLGMLFSTQSYTNTDSTTIPPIENFAHIYTDSVITDTVNWTIISGSFIADSSYTYVSIGNFFKNQNTDTIKIVNSPISSGAYYFIDDIRLSTDSLYTVTAIQEIYKENDLFIYPNPSNGLIKIKNPKNLYPYSVKIFNSIGQQVFYQNIFGTESLDLTLLVNGFYTIVITNSKTQYLTKLIIQK